MQADSDLWVAQIYAANIRSQSEVLRARVVDSCHTLRDSVGAYSQAFSRCAKVDYETMAEDELTRASRDLRHAADVVDAALQTIRANRGPLSMEAAE
ncbi:hypothetical protein [Azorhizobium caulinodans]|uniref:hypothetical protein n=1 Tax=Azorhizobium caulinodans TaxID=7 RepID=UPI002FBEE9DA